MSSFHSYPQWPSTDDFNRHVADFSPFIVTHTEEICSPSSMLADNCQVDVSCAPNTESTEFYGDPSKAEYVRLPLSSYVDAFNAYADHRPHHLHRDGLQLYLSQCLLFSSEESSDDRVVGHLIDSIHIPEILGEVELYEINLWMNIYRNTRSALHYDGNHNVLCVQRGCKEVLLVSPQHTPRLQPYTAFGISPNHSYMSWENLRSLDFVVIQEVRERQALFIPEGWWHQVTSSSCTMAINFWFRSPLHALLKKTTMTPYYLRAVMNALNESILQELRHKIYMDSDAFSLGFDEMTVDSFEECLKCTGHKGFESEKYFLFTVRNQSRLWLPSAQKVWYAQRYFCGKLSLI